VGDRRGARYADFLQLVDNGPQIFGPISGGYLSFLRTITDSDLDVRQMGWRAEDGAASLALGLLGTVRSPGSF
jgi:hypothetical protein